MNMRRVSTYSAVLAAAASLVYAASSDVADAAMKGNKQAVRSLIQQKSNVNAPQADGTTALHWAVRADDLETAQLLIGAGAKVSAANRDGATPLLLAAINGSGPHGKNRRHQSPAGPQRASEREGELG